MPQLPPEEPILPSFGISDHFCTPEQSPSLAFGKEAFWWEALSTFGIFWFPWEPQYQVWICGVSSLHPIAIALSSLQPCWQVTSWGPWHQCSFLLSALSLPSCTWFAEIIIIISTGMLSLSRVDYRQKRNVRLVGMLKKDTLIYVVNCFNIFILLLYIKSKNPDSLGSMLGIALWNVLLSSILVELSPAVWTFLSVIILRWQIHKVIIISTSTWSGCSHCIPKLLRLLSPFRGFLSATSTYRCHLAGRVNLLAFIRDLRKFRRYLLLSDEILGLIFSKFDSLRLWLIYDDLAVLVIFLRLITLKDLSLLWTCDPMI